MLDNVIYKLAYRRSVPEARPALVSDRLGVTVGRGCMFFGSVDFGSEPYLISMGDQVMLSENIRFVTHDGGVRVLDNMGILPKADVFGPISIGNNVFIGMDAIILRGVTIGDNVVIGAGSIVTRNVDSNSVWAGVPAHRIKSVEEYAEGLRDDAVPAYGMPADEKKAMLQERYGMR